MLIFHILSPYCGGFTLKTNPPPTPNDEFAFVSNAPSKIPMVASAPTDNASPVTPNSIYHPTTSNSKVALPGKTAALALAVNPNPS